MIRLTEHGWEFLDKRSGEWRTLKEPHGPATGRQLERLNREGLIRLVPMKADPVSKLDAAQALDEETEVRVG